MIRKRLPPVLTVLPALLLVASIVTAAAQTGAACGFEGHVSISPGINNNMSYGSFQTSSGRIGCLGAVAEAHGAAGSIQLDLEFLFLPDPGGDCVLTPITGATVVGGGTITGS